MAEAFGRAATLTRAPIPVRFDFTPTARLHRLVGIIEELSFTTVRHRLASFLLRLSQKESKHSATGVVITLPVSNQELASQIGIVRELVSRNLSRLQAEAKPRCQESL